MLTNCPKRGVHSTMFFIPFEKREEYYMTLEEADKENFKEYVARMLRLIIDQVRSYGHKEKKEE